ncbi:hypothetical protein M9H77_25134 [Catharanthus roseus]|uniref:Uncharacterized protein n=1 Tax=Catharanthus roseus TaxID=4058 RepID=A0ACC0AA13_CATRO|nr:hypothetical protein M9H77_25134 [Catharanthus roseus]
MAMQAGLGLSRILLLLGAGYGGTIMIKNGKLSDILGELQELLKKRENGEAEGEDAIAAQVRRLAMEVRQMASARPITVLNGGPGQNGFAQLLVPAAAVGALGYGYMWWKGIAFSDLMYVTKKSMANAVENLTKHLEHVSDALAATKKHLTQRIENLDGKLDDQVKISKEIKSEVTDLRGDLSQINYDLDDLHRMVSGLDGKLLSLEDKQDLANYGVAALLSFVNGKPLNLNEKFKSQFKVLGSSVPAPKGLLDVADVLDFGDDNNRSSRDDNTGDVNNTSIGKPSNIRRVSR